MSLHIAVCDDEAIAIGAISSAVAEALKSQGVACEISEYRSADELRRAMAHKQFDLLMLDIDMPDLNGIDFGRLLRQQNNQIDIVYISNREDRVFDAMQIQPKGFIRKSHFFADLNSYAKIIAEGLNRQDEPSVVLEDGSVSISIPLRKVICVEGSLKHQLFTVEGIVKPLVQKSSMKKLQDILEPHGFVKIHASYLVNYLYIERFDINRVLLKNGAGLPLSRSNAREAKEKYLQLMRDGGNITL